MADEQKGGQPATEGAETLSVARTDWEKADAAMKQQQALELEAEVMGFAGDPQGYLDYLKQTTYEHLSTKKPDAAPAAAQPKPAQPAAAAQPEPVRNDGSMAMSARALLESQYNGFLIGQSSLPEDQRSKHSRAELAKILESPLAPMIGQMAGDPQFEGNVFKAADFYLTFNETRRAPNPAATVATTRAATTSTLGPGVTVQAPGGPQGNHEEQLRGQIAPKTNDVYEGEKV